MEKKSNVPNIIKLLGLDKYIEKKTKGIINKDNLHYLYENPENYFKKIYTEEELYNFRKNLYDNFTPTGYDISTIERAFNAMIGNKDKYKEEYDKDVYYDNLIDSRISYSVSNPGIRDELFAKYLNLPSKNKYLVPTDMRPNKGKTYDRVYSFNRRWNPDFENSLVNEYFIGSDTKGEFITPYGTRMKLKKGKSENSYYVDKIYTTLGYNGNILPHHTAGGSYIISRGFDPEKGEYISYYDDYDLNPSIGGNSAGNPNYFGLFPIKSKDASGGLGEPFTIYDRVYLDDFYDIPEENRRNPYISPSIIIEDKNKLGGMKKVKKKKMLGAAIIGAATSLIGTGLNLAQQKQLHDEQMAQQKEQMNIANANTRITNLNQLANNDMSWAYDKFNNFRCGGKKRMKANLGKFKPRFEK